MGMNETQRDEPLGLGESQETRIATLEALCLERNWDEWTARAVNDTKEAN